jgi:DNA-binding CsgD family transcriptional regulator
VEDSEIAQKLQLHERTVKTHVETVREIAGVSARSGLARYFFDTGAYLCNSMSPKALDIWPQELLVLKKISYAKTNDEIAEALCLNPYMARKHRKNMTRRTGWRGRERLALAGFVGGNIGDYALRSAEVLATANEV